MRLDPVNAVSSFHYYMWNAWDEEELIAADQMYHSYHFEMYRL